jgi:hypothetical protein
MLLNLYPRPFVIYKCSFTSYLISDDVNSELGSWRFRQMDNVSKYLERCWELWCSRWYTKWRRGGHRPQTLVTISRNDPNSYNKDLGHYVRRLLLIPMTQTIKCDDKNTQQIIAIRNRKRGRRGSMVIGFTTTYATSAYHHWCCEFESRSGRGVHYVIKFVSDRSVVSRGTPVLSTNKTDCHDIAEILLKVALNTMTLTLIQLT